MNSWPTGKDPDTGKDWGQEEKGATEDKMVGWHHWLNGHEFEQAPGDGKGQGNLVCFQSMGSQRIRHNLANEQQQVKHITMHSSPKEVWSHKFQLEKRWEGRHRDVWDSQLRWQNISPHSLFFCLLNPSPWIKKKKSLNKIQKGPWIVKCRIGTY